ncbi:MAG: glycosyl hydrolase [Candidatus Hydrogenedens sp.]|jgi:hypothetical protein|nr:glycosyl hydrolase [Candidatus Hydrogenedens sp.]
MRIDNRDVLKSLPEILDHFFALTVPRLKGLAKRWDSTKGTPVFTQGGKYTSRGWTEWTQGFLYGCRLLCFDATGDEELLVSGREDTLRYMAPHLSHVGVHDHGFNNLSTYGNLRRLALEGRSDDTEDLVRLYELALKVSGAVQASRWTKIHDGGGYIHSFNGPQSLFVDTIRSCRILVVAHTLGHRLMGENDEAISLLDRAVEHIRTTLRYNVYYGTGRDIYDVRGRVAHESIFNVTDGRYRCPSTQQGYAAFSTWTRGLAWGLLGCAEQLEFFRDYKELLDEREDGAAFLQELEEGALAMADFFLENTPTDGVPYWDTGAPGLAEMGDYLDHPAEPDNDWEPVDSSAGAISAQGLLRLGDYLGKDGRGARYHRAGLQLAQTLLSPPYLSNDPDHEGVLLHTVYHRPNGWDYIPEGKKIPQGESALWGDYHALELAVYCKGLMENSAPLRFYQKT